MITAFDNLSVLEDDNVISSLDCLETMGYDDDGTSLEEILKSNIDLLLREAVECTGWFIEDDNLWIFDENLRDGETLALSSGESNSLLTYLRLESVLKLINEIALCEFNRFSEIFIRYFGSRTIGEILENRPVKYGWFLCEISDVSVIIAESYLGEILTIHKYGSTCRMEISRNKFGKGGFSRSRESHEGCFLASHNCEIKIFKDDIFLITEAEIFRLDCPIFVHEFTSFM